MFNLTDIAEAGNNWVAIAYANETADDKLIGRSYKVTAEINGNKFKKYFTNGTVAENKQTAYQFYYELEQQLNS